VPSHHNPHYSSIAQTQT
jgi:hypothetical protein